MSTRNILIILLVVVLLVLFLRNKTKIRTYELKGKVTMTNACTNNTVDLADKIRIKAKLHYQNTTVNPDSFDKANIAAATNATTREAAYSLKQTTTSLAKEWRVEAITRNDLSDICQPISCTSPQVCTDRSTVAGDPYTVPIPSGQTVVTQDYTFSCACGPRIQPTPRPTLQPFPTESPDEF